MDIVNQFAKSLKSLREERGLTINELARQTKISAAIINRWERGLRDPKLSSLNTLSEFFNCTIDYLVGKEY